MVMIHVPLKDTPASFIVDHLAEYFSDWKDPEAYGTKFYSPLAENDTAARQHLVDWYRDEKLGGRRRLGGQVPDFGILDDPRNGVFLQRPAQWNPKKITCRGLASIWFPAPIVLPNGNQLPMIAVELPEAMIFTIRERNPSKTELSIESRYLSCDAMAIGIAEYIRACYEGFLYDADEPPDKSEAPPEPSAVITNARDREIVKRWNEQQLTREIASAFNLSDHRVSTILWETRKKYPQIAHLIPKRRPGPGKKQPDQGPAPYPEKSG